MKRDLQLIKKILLYIEENYVNTSLINIGIDGYDLQQIGNHCSMLFEEGLLSKYAPRYGNGQLMMFTVGNLTNTGFNYLDDIRDKEDLQPYRDFNIYQDNSINISGRKVVNKNGIVGNSNQQSNEKKTDIGLTVKLPDLSK